MMKKYLVYISLFLMPAFTAAQQIPVYGLYFMDLYQINPAAAGINNFSALHLDHRQQWRGIEGAPVTSTLTLHFPVADKISIGVNFTNDTRGILATNSGLATFAYRIPLGKDHNLRFGLSGGVGWNNIDFSQIDDTSDPALINAIDNHMFLAGQFGALYNIKNFSLGFTFPTLFKSQIMSDQAFQDIQLNPLQNYYITASYKFNMGQNFALEPWVLYRANETQPSQLEGTLLLWIKNIVWAGATYRQDYGMAYEAGFRISDLIDLGYAYEPAGSMVNGFGNATHQLHLSIRIGKKRTSPVTKTEPDMVATTVPPVVEEPPQEETEWQEEVTPIPPPETKDEKVYDPMIEDQKTDEPMRIKRGNHLLELPIGNYVIAGAFRIFENAEGYSDKLFKQGYEANFGFLTAKNLYYVWIYSGKTPQDARIHRDEFRKIQQFNDVWFLLVEE